MSKNYMKKREELREEVRVYIEEGYPYSYEGLMIMCEYFEKMGRRFGLLTESRENGII